MAAGRPPPPLHPRPFPPWPRAIEPDVASAVDQLSAPHREFFEERAGILEFESGLPRAVAEREALAQTREYYGLSD